MTRARSLHACWLAILTGGALAAPMAPGLWSLSMTVEIGGQSETLPVVSECISQRDIDDGTRALPRPEGRCSLTNVERTDERATYDLACTNGTLVSKGRAEIRFATDRYDGTVAMTIAEGGAAPQSVAMQITAQRVGNCTK